MMQIVYYSDRDQLLAEINSLSETKIFVTESPMKADNLRTSLGGSVNQDVVTIAKFTSDMLKVLWTDEAKRPVIKRKSELLLIFGILRNKLLPQLGYEQFNQAYGLFSELRSFSLSLEALTSVLDEQPREIQEALKMFWMVLENMNLLDEHGAYHAISEALRAGEEVLEQKKTFIFWGFQHLNGQQIDLIKSLSIRYQVIIPFPGGIKHNLKRSDWISWLVDHKVQEKILPDISKTPKADWLVVNSREMSRHLKGLSKGTQVLLGVSKLTIHHMDIIPQGASSFKVGHELFKSSLNSISEQLFKDEPKDLLNWLETTQKTLLLKKNPEDFRKLKVLQLYQEALEFIGEVTDEPIIVEPFFLKLLKEVVALNLPRTFYIPTFNSDVALDLLDLSMLESVDYSKNLVFCIDDRFDDFQGLGQSYTESMQKSLAALGPIKRSELEFLFKRTELIDLFSHTQVRVLMPESVTKHSLIWKKVFDGVTLNRLEDSSLAKATKPVDVFKGMTYERFSEHLSASKLQTYHDCPRKFYFTFIEKISPDLRLKNNLDNKIMGILVHHMIQIFFDRGSSEEQIPQIVKEVLDERIKEQGLDLSPHVYADRLTVLLHRTRNGVSFLRKLEDVSGQTIKWSIEKKFEFEKNYKVKGSIDCIGVSESHVWLLDFKSTESSAASNTEVSSVDNLQLWVYSIAAEKIIPEIKSKFMIHGFVVLDKPGTSNLFFEDLELLDKIKSQKILSPTTWVEPFTEQLIMAKEKIDKIASAVFNDKSFPASPRSSDACNFCELSKVCTKGELTHGRA